MRYTRFAVVAVLALVSVPTACSQPIDVWVGEGARDFRPYRVSKKIYGTGWDGTVKVRATLNGTFIVTRNN